MWNSTGSHSGERIPPGHTTRACQRRCREVLGYISHGPRAAVGTIARHDLTASDRQPELAPQYVSRSVTDRQPGLGTTRRHLLPSERHPCRRVRHPALISAGSSGRLRTPVALSTPIRPRQTTEFRLCDNPLRGTGTRVDRLPNAQPDNLPVLLRILATDGIDRAWDLEQAVALSLRASAALGHTLRGPFSIFAPRPRGRPHDQHSAATITPRPDRLAQ